MTRNDNVSRLSGRWRNFTKECKSCGFKLKNWDNKLLCKYNGLTFFLSTKTKQIHNKCTLKSN